MLPIYTFLIGALFLIIGCFMIFIPNQIYALILLISILLSLWHSIHLLLRGIKTHQWMNFLLSVVSFCFALFLCNDSMFPRWVIRVGFASYTLLYGICEGIQYGIYRWNGYPNRIFSLLNAVSFLFLGFYLLFYQQFSSNLIMILFGVYILLLGFRYINDAFETVDPWDKYKWQRKYRLSLPAILCALIPDALVKYITQKKDFFIENTSTKKSPLRILVHVGSRGFQKVGHITLVFHDTVYSYGNYDVSSHHFNGTVGDGIFFTCSYKPYMEMITEQENNSIFEFGLSITKQQEEQIEKKLEELRKDTRLWNAPIDQEIKQEDWEDYSNRLVYFVHPVFYKFYSGRFKTYWALGTNCALFVDTILGTIGADRLNLRGIISPGVYLDWLQREFVKPKSPVITRCFYEKKK